MVIRLLALIVLFPVDTLGSRCSGPENRPPNHHWVEREGEHEIKDDACDHGPDVVPQSALGNRRPARIAAVFEGDAVIDGPGQHGSEQDDAADVATDRQMRHCPSYHGDQHGVLKRKFDAARKIGGGKENADLRRHRNAAVLM